MWVYVIISGIVFMWLSEYFILEKKESGEEYGMEDNWRVFLIGVIIAISWVLSIPIFVIPKLKEGGDK